MEWIPVTDKLPEESGHYLVFIRNCDKCWQGDNNHYHKMIAGQDNFIDIYKWSKADMYLVNYKRNEGDSSWDHCAKDRWTESGQYSENVTHWMSLPLIPSK